MKNNIIIGCILGIVSGLALWGLLSIYPYPMGMNGEIRQRIIGVVLD